jgi:hypothetical protein
MVLWSRTGSAVAVATRLQRGGMERGDRLTAERAEA